MSNGLKIDLVPSKQQIIIYIIDDLIICNF